MWKLILSAGASSRMGYPKALATIRGTSLIQWHISDQRNLFKGIAVVLGCHMSQIGPKCQRSEVSLVENPHWEGGQHTSVRAGLEFLPSQEPVLLTPVDCPPVHPSTTQKLIQAFNNQASAWAAVPHHREKPGHPILLSPKAIQHYLAQPDPTPMNQFLAQMENNCLPVPVEDERILKNINTPKELHQYLEVLA